MGKNPFEMVGGFVSDAAKNAADMAGNVVNVAEKAADDAGKVAGNIASEAGKAAEGVGKNLVDAVQDAGKVAAGVAGDAARTLQGAAAIAGSTVGKVAGEAAGIAAGGAQAVADAVQKSAYELKKNKYNPIFPDEYFSSDYDRPNMIILVDEDTRKGIDVCEGAMGWFSKEGELEVLHLYMKDIKRSGIGFYPSPILGAVYYVDTFNPERYIKIDEYFKTAKRDQRTELQEIACALGAKKCTIELVESEKTKKKNRIKAGASLEVAKGNGQGEYSSVDYEENKKSVVAVFSGDAEPVYPKLRWFAHDREIHFLINSRLSDGSSNKMKDYRLSLESSSSETMSLEMAAKIDTAIKGLKIKADFSFQGKVKKEKKSYFMYSVEF